MKCLFWSVYVDFERKCISPLESQLITYGSSLSETTSVTVHLTKEFGFGESTFGGSSTRNSSVKRTVTGATLLTKANIEFLSQIPANIGTKSQKLATKQFGGFFHLQYLKNVQKLSVNVSKNSFQIVCWFFFYLIWQKYILSNFI